MSSMQPDQMSGANRADLAPGSRPQEGVINLRDEEHSLGELFSEMTKEVTFIMRKEVELAKIETKEEMQQAGKAGAMFGGAAAAGYLCMLMLAFAAAWGLAAIMPAGFAFLIVGVIFGAVAAFFAMKGKKQMKNVHPVPEQTIETLKEDAQWAKQQLK